MTNIPSAKPPLLEQVRQLIRFKHYSIRTEEAYVRVIKQFILYHHKRHPIEMGAEEIRQYLTHLAIDGRVAASTQNVALSALIFLYREVLCMELDRIAGVERAKRPLRLPTVLTREEVLQLLGQLSGLHNVMASLLYGAGLRLMECLRLRVKDLDFSYGQITIRDGKGEKDRRALLPASVADDLRRQLATAKALHDEDLGKGYGRVYLPYALDRKYPGAATNWSWQWVFPSTKMSVDPRSGEVRRHHASEDALQREVKKAASRANIANG